MKFQLCFQFITRFLLFVLLGANSVHPQQLPSGANFQAGIGKINYHNSSVYIRQSSSRAVIDWQSFNVGQGGAVHFIQPNQAAATLNRVTGGGVSQILGQIKAPGRSLLPIAMACFLERLQALMLVVLLLPVLISVRMIS